MKNIFANTKFAGKILHAFFAIAILTSTAAFANPSIQNLPKLALPTNGQVVAGNASISQSQTATSATMNVNQTSQRAVINWDSFNVGKNASISDSEERTIIQQYLNQTLKRLSEAGKIVR